MFVERFLGVTRVGKYLGSSTHGFWLKKVEMPFSVVEVSIQHSDVFL